MEPAARARMDGPSPSTGAPPAMHAGMILYPGPGSPKVKIENGQAWRATIDSHMCLGLMAPGSPTTHGPEKCYKGSFSVLIQNQMAVRVGDTLLGMGPPAQIKAFGRRTVFIGDIAFGLADQAAMDEF